MSKFENTYWTGNGKYQYIVNVIKKRVPERGNSDQPNVEQYRIAGNAYYDYFNNGGCNRIRLTELKAVKLTQQRGTHGSKSLSTIKSYAPRNPDIVLGGYLPESLATEYERMMDAVIEENFPELIIDDSVNGLDTFKVTFANGITQTLTKDCLLDCYLNSSVNHGVVIDYEKVDDC